MVGVVAAELSAAGLLIRGLLQSHLMLNPSLAGFFIRLFFHLIVFVFIFTSFFSFFLCGVYAAIFLFDPFNSLSCRSFYRHWPVHHR